MKSKGFSQTAFLAVLALALVVSASACATLAQVRPTTPEPFLGKWGGAWNDFGGGDGEVKLDVSIRPDKLLMLSVNLTRSRFGFWQVPARFENGELVVDRESLYMVLSLHGDGDQMVGTYHNKITGSRGIWSLTRRKG